MDGILKQHVLERFVDLYYTAMDIQKPDEYYGIRIRDDGWMWLEISETPFTDPESGYLIHELEFTQTDLYVALALLYRWAEEEAPRLIEGNI